MITVLFFAKLREDVGVDCLKLPAETLHTMADVIRHLSSTKGERMAAALAAGNIIMACNHEVVDDAYPVNDGDEVAFFPPVTGG